MSDVSIVICLYLLRDLPFQFCKQMAELCVPCVSVICGSQKMLAYTRLRCVLISEFKCEVSLTLGTGKQYGEWDI